ncbi:hypothetical protein ACHAXA_006407 [Cyclostephanos tholiformis]|uniref:Uncharacterized protein n=1 Tax=Cyclostephanos tholiformis TaxID=382380 RepID=A0ABD3SE70_9STRA
MPPHLFLHFDINETILVGDVAGGDTLEDCLNKIIAKCAFVSSSSPSVDARDNVVVDRRCRRRSRDDTVAYANENDDDVDDIDAVRGGRGDFSDDFAPVRWWDGTPLTMPDGVGGGGSIRGVVGIDVDLDVNVVVGDDDVGRRHRPNRDDCDLGEEYYVPPPPPPSSSSSSPPPPLYTGWTWPRGTRPYYRTRYKDAAKRFTNRDHHGSIYRPVYDALHSRLLPSRGVRTGGEEGGGGDGRDYDDCHVTPFDDFVPAFFHALVHYFPSEAGGDARRDDDDDDDDPSSRKRRLPRPRSTTLVLRTFGSDLHRVADCVTKFARGEHPSFPNYRNRDLIFGEGDIVNGRWTNTTVEGRRGSTRDGEGVGDGHDGDDEDEEEYEERDKKGEGIGGIDEGGGRLVYELHHQLDDDLFRRRYSGDDEVLNFLESRTVVGILDDYEFWRDNNQAPWSGKPIWSRRMAGGKSRTGGNDAGGGGGGGGGVEGICGGGDEGDDCRRRRRRRRRCPIRHDHHHILLDDNIHNDPNDGIGAVRAPIPVEATDETNDDNCREYDVITRTTTTTTTTTATTRSSASYVSLRGNDLLKMHGKHLIRVPTLRPLLEDDWFVRRIEDARWRIFLEEEEEEKEEEEKEEEEEVVKWSQERLIDGKLKRVALETLQSALLPNNSKLQIRFTVVDSSSSSSSVHGEKEESQGKNKMKLSACDRDATVIRSQLEPLSTPQLRKRLEQSFVWKARGIPASPERLASLLAELEAIPWPRTTRERPKIRAEHYMILQRPGSGKSDSARTRKETAKLTRYRNLFDSAVEAMAEIDSTFAERFTALAVTKNFVGSPHIDTLNVGPFYGLSL